MRISSVSWFECLQENPPLHFCMYVLDTSRKNEIIGEFKVLWVELGYWNVEEKKKNHDIRQISD